MVADLRPLDLGYVWGRGRARLTARPWVPVSSLSTHMVYLLPFLSNLAGSKGVFFSARPPDPDTMTNSALEALLPRAAKITYYNEIELFFFLPLIILIAIRIHIILKLDIIHGKPLPK